jgi:hypothetical protein
MAIPIFPNSSYFIAFGGSPVFFEEIRLASLRHQARIYACRSRYEFLEAMSTIRFKAAIFLDGIGLNQKELPLLASEVATRSHTTVCFATEKANSLFSTLPNVRTMLLPSDAKTESWRSGFDDFMITLTPPQLDQIVQNAANAIFPRFFPATKGFSRIPFCDENADYVLIHSISDGDLIGQFLVRVKWSEICKLLPGVNSDRTSEKILDILKEATNQCGGLIAQAIIRLHPNCNMKLGLPTGFDLLKIPKVQFLHYFPAVNVIDEGNRIGVSMGLLNLNREKIPDLSGYVDAQSSDSIEFL